MKAHYKCGQRSALMISLRLMSPRGQEGPHGWSEEPVVCVCVCVYSSASTAASSMDGKQLIVQLTSLNGVTEKREKDTESFFSFGSNCSFERYCFVIANCTNMNRQIRCYMLNVRNANL